MEINQNENLEVIIKTNKNIFNSPMAVLATNAYSKLLDNFFAEKVFPTRGQVLVTEPINLELFEGKVIYADYGYEYFRQLPNKRILVGGFRQQYAQTEIGFSDETTWDIQEGLYNFLIEHFPQTQGIKITHRWAGLMGFSVDGMPLIGSLPKYPNIIASVGFTGHGMAFGFVLGKGLAEQILTGKSSYPLNIFSIKRFL
jgi:glycine/D-amino acid oxidase-like deaminating enzyme